MSKQQQPEITKGHLSEACVKNPIWLAEDTRQWALAIQHQEEVAAVRSSPSSIVFQEHKRRKKAEKRQRQRESANAKAKPIPPVKVDPGSSLRRKRRTLVYLVRVHPSFAALGCI
jgi:hypothetical protein